MADERLATNGDVLERQCWTDFVAKEFPGYEVFWYWYVVPLTNRPADIHFKTDKELKKLGKDDHDL